MANFPSDMRSENELVELLWDNGQIVMQGQSNRAKKTLFSPVLDLEDETAMVKFGHSGATNQVVHDLPSMVPCRSLGMNVEGEDGTDPWMGYEMDESSLEKGFCPELFSDLAGIQSTSLANTDNNLLPTGVKELSTLRFSQKSKSKVMGSDVNPCKRDHFAANTSSSSAAIMNFSHFSRPVALAKANRQSIERSKVREKSCTASVCPVESSFVNQPKVDLSSCTTRRENSSRESLTSQALSFTASTAVERKEAEGVPEAIAASSSGCSGYSFDAISNDPKPKSKRRNRDESGEQSDDFEDESCGVKKPEAARVAGVKRGRAAEVHNLSERRRRDRINEKMKALQELIPNCNKVDKASMLDEAIEYLKTLQLQVQMMSMGTGICIPPILIPTGMNLQQMHPPLVPRFSPLAMGMGLGFGMGMIDLNGFPVPSMHGTQFPSPSIPLLSGLHRMSPSSSIPSIGIPAQSFAASVPHASQVMVLNPSLPVSEIPTSTKQATKHELGGAG
ncbi:hypothetical protein HPP92_012359 [Vanilla planifolia]|uniref:BHLH domain-containing protein n=1 Tax=Vanilla planifolia TaxID=51239 RepID=A0A835UYZ0_VANPL|nr:hypothetical protein HPP92_012760 [Vanilla planifolia]KAG0477640.1 hypothetical protein HPP92_012359 [Vanilla planifolia]